MMEWIHKCSLEWLQKRQKYLTASDVRKLIPLTATGRSRKVDEETYLKVYANKLTMLTKDDCISYGAAARGHLLEPFAVEALNQILDKKLLTMKFYHWDDEIISVEGRSLAFSPDAMTHQDDASYADGLAEIKCYSDEKHLATACRNKRFIEERWQIACAMAVLDNIDYAFLVLFNPRMTELARTFAIRYSRHDLQDEIDMILKIEDDWNRFVERIRHRGFPTPAVFSHDAGKDESEIIEILEKSERLSQQDVLNPTYIYLKERR